MVCHGELKNASLGDGVTRKIEEKKNMLIRCIIGACSDTDDYMGFERIRAHAIQRERLIENMFDMAPDENGDFKKIIKEKRRGKRIVRQNREKTLRCKRAWPPRALP